MASSKGDETIPKFSKLMQPSSARVEFHSIRHLSDLETPGEVNADHRFLIHEASMKVDVLRLRRVLCNCRR